MALRAANRCFEGHKFFAFKQAKQVCINIIKQDSAGDGKPVLY